MTPNKCDKFLNNSWSSSLSYCPCSWIVLVANLALFSKTGQIFFIWLRTKKVFGTSMQTCATSSIKFVLKHLMHASMHFGHKRNSFKIADSFFQGILDRFRSRFSQATSKKFSYIYHTTINKSLTWKLKLHLGTCLKLKSS